MEQGLNCIVCNKEIVVIPPPDYQVVGGSKIHVDVDEGSRYYKYNKTPAEGPPFLKKLVATTHITAFICDDCFLDRHERCYGTIIEVKRSYQDVFPDDTTREPDAPAT